MINSKNTTLLKKLLKFFLPILIIPIVVVVIFYHYYLNSIITKGIINQTKNTIVRISNSASIQEHLKTSKDVSVPNIAIVDTNVKIISKNIFYDKNLIIIKQHIKDALEKKDNAVYHDEINKFMMKPIYKHKEIVEFVIIDYRKNIEKRLATTSQTFIFIILVVIFILFISVIFTIIFALQITNPVKELIDGTKAISKGDKSYKINITTNDEIAILANSFNIMVDDINQKQQDIESLNKNLLDQVKVEVEKSRQKDKHLIEQSRLAQMGEMISMIAHQWRQPLAAISATSGTLVVKARLNNIDKESVLELSKNISEYSHHLSSTINDFRDFFKSNKDKQNITYDSLIKDVLNIVEESIINKNITIVKNLTSKVVFDTYSNEIKQVILNLIKNAEDILIENKVENPTIIIDTKDNMLSISDNGGGVPNKIIGKIFDPYFTTKPNTDGTGLGLYMSKTIIEEHCDGKLSVLNSKNGAVFTIILGENNG